MFKLFFIKNELFCSDENSGYKDPTTRRGKLAFSWSGNLFMNRYFDLYVSPVLKVSANYVSMSSDFVDDIDQGTLHSLEAVIRSNSEFSIFYKKVEELMRTQCDCPSGGDDCHIHLSPVFMVSVYRDEDEFIKNSPRTYSFIKFTRKFYKRVKRLRIANSDHHFLDSF